MRPDPDSGFPALKVLDTLPLIIRNSLTVQELNVPTTSCNSTEILGCSKNTALRTYFRPSILNPADAGNAEANDKEETGKSLPL